MYKNFGNNSKKWNLVPSSWPWLDMLRYFCFKKKTDVLSFPSFQCCYGIPISRNHSFSFTEKLSTNYSIPISDIFLFQFLKFSINIRRSLIFYLHNTPEFFTSRCRFYKFRIIKAILECPSPSISLSFLNFEHVRYPTGAPYTLSKLFLSPSLHCNTHVCTHIFWCKICLYGGDTPPSDGDGTITEVFSFSFFFFLSLVSPKKK